ncbi:MAG: carboxypeptidase-like regulatory domain-containing protein [Candidatus Sericytochromatia bacterium]
MRATPTLLLLTALLAGCQLPAGLVPVETLARPATTFALSMAREASPTPSLAPETAPAVPVASPTPRPTERPRSSGSGSSRPPSTPAPTPTPGPAGVVTNTIPAGPGSLEGRILDPYAGGAPVAGALLTITGADPAHEAVLRTGPDGEFSLTGLELGSYFLLAAKPGHTGATAPLKVTLYPSEEALGGVRLVLVAN